MPNDPVTEQFARLEARVPVNLHTLLKRAARIQGRSITDFVVTAVQEAAQKAVEDIDIIRLSADDQRRFAEALLNPPEPNAALRRAAEAHRRLVGPE